MMVPPFEFILWMLCLGQHLQQYSRSDNLIFISQLLDDLLEIRRSHSPGQNVDVEERGTLGACRGGLANHGDSTGNVFGNADILIERYAIEKLPASPGLPTTAEDATHTECRQFTD